MLWLFTAVTSALGAADRLPPPELDLQLAAPIQTWDEAVPLGNGLLGGLLWGEGGTLRLSLDRGDLWDLRPTETSQRPEWTYATIRRLVAEGNQAEVSRLFDAPYNDEPNPTKIPAGRIEIDLGGERKIESFRLHLAEAEGRAELDDGSAVRCFYSAAQPVALLMVPGDAPADIRILPPASVAALGYPEADVHKTEDAVWYLQPTAEGGAYCGFAGVRRVDGVTLLAITVTSTADGADPVAMARERAEKALGEGYDRLFEAHRAWWAGFWAQSEVDVPEPEILRHYYLVRYFYGAASRLGAPPLPLQGVWTADAGGLPPWKGDYHHDLNTQMTYLPYNAEGHFEEGQAFLEFLWELLPAFRRFARTFHECGGAIVPGVMGLDGQPLGGWSQYSLSPANSGWLAWMFYQHWVYTADRDFLEARAYPWCAEVSRAMLAILEEAEDGHLRLPLSSSPEIHNNSLQAWLVPDSNYDLACVRALLSATRAMAEELGRDREAGVWREAEERLGDWLLEAETGELVFSAGEPVRESHRHFSHTMAIHPFGQLNLDQGEAARRTIEATCERYDSLGTQAWCGYSFSWMSCLRARVGDAEAAVRNLDLFVKAFILRNGFHVNGDQTGSGFSGFTYRPFTLEGNFLASSAVDEMLLQSWSPEPFAGQPGVIRLFPATPWRWHDASFADLRAEGGHRVSARRENNATVWFKVAAGSDGEVRIRDNFGGRDPRWSRDGVRREGQDFVVTLRREERITAELQRPDAIPDAPEDLAEPVKIGAP